MQKTVKHALAALLLALLALYSCRKEPTFWEDDFVAPIAQGKLTLGNLFPDTTIQSNPDSSLRIAFETEVINYGLDSLLKIPDTTIKIKTSLPLPIPATITPCTQVISATVSETYFPISNGVKLTRADIKSGYVDIMLLSSTKQPIVYTYTLTSATQNNTVLTYTFNIPGRSGSNPGVTTHTIDLAGYSIDFSGINQNSYNTVTQEYAAAVSCAAQTDTIFPTDSLVVTYTFKNIVPQYAQGYFGNESVIVGPDTSNFEVFTSIQSGMLNLNSADVQLKIVNEFGVSMRATLNDLTGISTPNATATVLTSTVVGNDYNINPAINNGPSAPVTASTKNITLNNSNSNIKDFIGILPDKISYQVNTELNPGGNLGGNNDFAYYGTAFKAYLSADIPLHFAASNLVLSDTVDIDVSTVSQLDNVNHGQLLLTATNSYPFSISLQGYLLDENKVMLEPLFATPNTIQQPPLDANLKVIAPLKSTLTVPLNKDKIANLKKARYIQYLATFNTAAQPSLVKFYSHYTLDILLTADINYTIGK